MFQVPLRCSAFACLVMGTWAHLFTSTWSLRKMAEKEADMVETLRSYVTLRDFRNESVHEKVKRFLDHLDAIKHVTSRPDFVEHPINAFQFLRRMSRDWTEVQEILSSERATTSQVFITQMRQIHQAGPGAVDSTDELQAARAVIRLWQTYSLNLEELLRGQILDKNSTSLSTEEMFFITDQLHEDRKYREEVTWLEQILVSLQTGGLSCDTGNCFRRASRKLASVYSSLGMACQSIDVITDAIHNDTATPSGSLKRDLEFYQTKVVGCGATSGQRNVTITTDPVTEHRWALCRGEIRRPVKTLSRLSCLYRYPPEVPFYRVREEILSLEPLVSVMYNVTSDSEARAIREIAAGMLNVSKTGPPVSTVGDSVFNIRISETAWIPDSVAPLVKRLSHRVQLLTGLSTSQDGRPLLHAEDTQVLNYGIGGMYHPHFDYLEIPVLPNQPVDVRAGNGYSETEMLMGERTATWIFYLSDVRAGGSTIFTRLNITVPAIQLPTSGYEKLGKCFAGSVAVNLTVGIRLCD